MACRDVEFSVIERFKDPRQRQHNRNNKRGTINPKPSRNSRRNSLWAHALPNSRRYPLTDAELHIRQPLKDACEQFVDYVTLFDLIKACGRQKDLGKGSSIHTALLEKGLLGKNAKFSGLGTSLANALLSMYAKCGALAKAKEIFDELPVRSIVSWNALISAYAQHGLGVEALGFFQQMQDEGLSPNAVTYICLMKACASIRSAEKGEEIHIELDRQGLLKTDFVLGSALVDMYCKCGALAKAQAVFDKLPERNLVTWNGLIAGYAEHGLGDEALSCFAEMQKEGLSPDSFTFVCLLQACGSIGAIEKGVEIHAEIDRQRLLGKSIQIGTTLVDMYGKCGELLKAQEVFDELLVRDVVTWTALIAGYAEHGLGEEALRCFDQLREEGILPTSVTYICILKACGSIGALERGKEIHTEVQRLGLLEKNALLGTTLVDMYMNCGEFVKAHEVFDKLPARDVATWTALMSGYAQATKVQIVVDLFKKMVREGVEPDMVTFGILLSTCSHAGLVEEGQKHIKTMSLFYGVIPSIEHRTCLVDLFCRAGQYEKAISVIEKALYSDLRILWLALLGACRKWLNVELGRWAFEHVIQLDKKHADAYVCMCNIYTAAGMGVEAEQIQALGRKNKAWKALGRCWWTDVRGDVHVFTMGEKKHSQMECIHAKIDEIGQKLQIEGYSVPPTNVSIDALCTHGEKMAIACALINTADGTPIRVTKNERVCEDCHIFTLLISKIERRKIHVIDASRIHIFEDGECHCKNYNGGFLS